MSERSVLIVDGSQENREVLETALERRGCKTMSAGRAERGLQLAQEHHPDVIVLDLELCDTSPEDLCAPFRGKEATEAPHLVVLGSVRSFQKGVSDGEFVAKPYHYGPLIRKIEELLDAAGQGCARYA